MYYANKLTPIIACATPQSLASTSWCFLIWFPAHTCHVKLPEELKHRMDRRCHQPNVCAGALTTCSLLLFEPIIPAVDIETCTIGVVSVVLLCFTLVVHNSSHRNIIALPAYALLNASCFIKPPSRYEVPQCCSPRGRGSRHHNRWERNGDEVQAHRYSCRQLRCKTRYQPLFAPIKEHQYT